MEDKQNHARNWRLFISRPTEPRRYMNDIKKIVFVVISLLFLAGCGTTNVRNDYALSQQSQKGLVIGSLTQSKSSKGHQGFSSAISGISLVYRNTETEETGRIGIDSTLPGPLYSGDFSNAKGELIAVELPPGDYVFEKWHALQGSYTNVYSNIPYPIKFSVYRNRAVYIGNLNLEIIFGRNIIGIGIVAGGLVTVNDSRERDIRVLLTRYPNIEPNDIVYELAKSKRESPGNASRETPFIPVPSGTYKQ